MEIRTNQQGTWSVYAQWMGAVRPVFTGSLYECLAYTAEVVS
jgi:hypothetical protein